MSAAQAPVNQTNERVDQPSVESQRQLRMLVVVSLVAAMLACAALIVSFVVPTNAAAQMAGVPGLPTLPGLPSGPEGAPSMPAQLPSALPPPSVFTSPPATAPVLDSPTAAAGPLECRYVTENEIAKLTDADSVQSTDMGPGWGCQYQYQRQADPTDPMSAVVSSGMITVGFFAGVVLPTGGTRMSVLGQAARWDSAGALMVRTHNGLLTVTLSEIYPSMDTHEQQQLANAVCRLAAPRLP